MTIYTSIFKNKLGTTVDIIKKIFGNIFFPTKLWDFDFKNFLDGDLIYRLKICMGTYKMYKN